MVQITPFTPAHAEGVISVILPIQQAEFEIPITQEELAGLVGASRERVNKALSSFMRLGWIEQNDRAYRILKRRELEIRAM